MIQHIERRKTGILFKAISFVVVFTFTLTMVMPPRTAYAQSASGVLNLPLPGTMVPVSPGFVPVIIRAVTIHPDNPFKFNFIVDGGDLNPQGKALEEESKKLIKYFLASLTTPEEDLWVNLSPYEKERIVPESFGGTEMGRDLLAQDYMLKQLTASLMYPEDETGKAFWKRVYDKAFELYGTTEIPINTFNKVWIVPEQAVIYEHEGTAYIMQSHLKVLLEEDYLALDNNRDDKSRGTDILAEKDENDISNISSQVVREVLLPEIEKEVNEGKNFANLRQITNSLILAVWYKKTLRQSILAQMYVDQNKTKGIETDDKEIKEKIYQQYLRAFKKGVYGYIKEDYDPRTQEVIPRKYFSGGFSGELSIRTEQGVVVTQLPDRIDTFNNLGAVPRAARDEGMLTFQRAAGKTPTETKLHNLEVETLRFDEIASPNALANYAAQKRGGSDLAMLTKIKPRKISYLRNDPASQKGRDWMTRKGVRAWEAERDEALGLLKINEKGEIRFNEEKVESPEQYYDHLRAKRREMAEEFERTYPQEKEFIPFEGHIAEQPLPSRREVKVGILSGNLRFDNGKVIPLVGNIERYQKNGLKDQRAEREIESSIIPHIEREDRTAESDALTTIASLKELDTSYNNDTPPYIVSNEDWEHMIWTLQHIPKVDKDQQSVHVGFSGLTNYDIMAERGSQLGVLLDINDRVIALHELVAEIMRDPEVKNKEQFKERFIQKINERKKYFLGQGIGLPITGSWEQVKVYLEAADGWLQDDQKFAHIRRMYQEGRIVALRADITDTEKIRKISDWVRKTGSVVDTLYITNIFDWLETQSVSQETKKKFAESISQLSDGRTLLLEAPTIFESKVTLARLDPRVRAVRQDRAMLTRKQKIRGEVFKMLALAQEPVTLKEIQDRFPPLEKSVAERVLKTDLRYLGLTTMTSGGMTPDQWDLRPEVKAVWTDMVFEVERVPSRLKVAEIKALKPDMDAAINRFSASDQAILTAPDLEREIEQTKRTIRNLRRRKRAHRPDRFPRHLEKGLANQTRHLAELERKLVKTRAESSPGEEEVGGIDLNPINLDLQIKRDENGMPLPIQFQEIQNINIEGLIPVIINVTPVTSLPMFSALEEETPQQLSLNK